VGIIRGKALLRALISNANRTMAACFDGGEDPLAVLEAAERSLMDLAQSRVRSGFSAVSDLQAATQSQLENLYTNRQLVTGVATGFTDLDRLTSGFQNSDLVILAARPAMGKTAIALNIAVHAALRENRHVAFFSLEMAKSQLMLRMLCAHSMTDAHKVRTGYLAREDMPRLIEGLATLARAPLFIDDNSMMTIVELRAKCKRLQRERGLGMVVIDYLQLMSGSGKIENRQQEISSISRGLKSMAKDLQVPVIALSQLSRAPEQRTGDHRPMMSDLRESGSIEQDADMVLMLFREEVYKSDETNQGMAELIIAKQRNGPTGTVKLAFLKQFNKFENLLEGY
jgi:replicative DNA helicase